MKILFVGHDASKTGAPISLLTLIHGIKNMEPHWDISLILMSGGPLLAKYYQNVKTFIYNPPSKSRYLRFRRFFTKKNNEFSDLTRFITDYKPDLIYINTIVPIPFIIPLKFKFKVTIVCHVREMEMVFMRYIKEEDKKYFRTIDHFFVVNSTIGKYLEKKFGVEEFRISVTPGPFDLMRYPKKERNTKKKPLNIAMAGTPIFRKGIDISIHLASLMKNQDVCFHWFGGLSKDKLLELQFEIDKRNLSSIYKLMGEVDDVYSSFFEMDVFFMSSREDPFPRVAVEAALAELPIIYFKGLTGVEDFLNDELAGLGVKYLDYDLLVSSIHTLVDNEEMRLEIGKKARISAIHYLEQNDTIRKIRNEIINLI